MKNIDGFLDNMVVFTNKILTYNSMKITCANLMQNDLVVYSGIITPNTKRIYRSLASRSTLLIEMNKDIFEFDGYGEIYWEKVYKFLRVFFMRC